MNLVENYIEPGYTVRTVRNKAGESFVKFDGFVNCYGNVTHQSRIWTIDQWQQIKKQGYFLG